MSKLEQPDAKRARTELPFGQSLVRMLQGATLAIEWLRAEGLEHVWPNDGPGVAAVLAWLEALEGKLVERLDSGVPVDQAFANPGLSSKPAASVHPAALDELAERQRPALSALSTLLPEQQEVLDGLDRLLRAGKCRDAPAAIARLTSLLRNRDPALELLRCRAAARLHCFSAQGGVWEKVAGGSALAVLHKEPAVQNLRRAAAQQVYRDAAQLFPPGTVGNTSTWKEVCENNMFAVVDLCSGRGKTLLGFALKQQLQPEVKVVHINCSVGLSTASQDVYSELQADSHAFFAALMVDVKQLAVQDLMIAARHIPSTETLTPAHLLEHYSTITQWLLAKQGDSNLLLLYLDEVPPAMTEMMRDRLHLVLLARNIVRAAESMVPILAGTSSRAANALGDGLGAGPSAVSRGTEDRPWAYAYTRLPGLLPTDFIKAEVASVQNAEVRKLVRWAIDHGGNPWLIQVALTVGKCEAQFQQWASRFGLTVRKMKPLLRTPDGLAAQANLMLEASAVGKFADALLSCHFGKREFGDPEDALVVEELEPKALWIVGEEAPDWLRLIRKLGVQVFPDDERQGEGRWGLWERVSFAPFRRDPLPYFACASAEGFFVLQADAGERRLTARQVLKGLLQGGRVSVNLQNPVAPTQSGDALEVLAELALQNAACRKLFAPCPAPSFLMFFLWELGLEIEEREFGDCIRRLQAAMSDWTEFLVPDSQPGGATLHRATLPEGVRGVQRVQNADEFDVEIHSIARFETKMHADPFGGADIVGVQRKCLKTCKLGVLVAQRTTHLSDRTLTQLSHRSHVLVLHFSPQGHLIQEQYRTPAEATGQDKWFVVFDMGGSPI